MHLPTALLQLRRAGLLQTRTLCFGGPQSLYGEGLRFGVADGSALGSDLSKRRPRQSSMKRIGLYFEFAETGRALLRRRLQFAARLVVYAEARGI